SARRQTGRLGDPGAPAGHALRPPDLCIMGLITDSPTSTFDLLEKARAGDEDALSRAFDQYRRRLAVLVHFKLSPQARQSCEVDDIVQETCLRAFRDLDRFQYQSPGSFLRWLSSIADHVIVDRVRYQGRARRAGDAVPFRSPSNPLGPE